MPTAGDTCEIAESGHLKVLCVAWIVAFRFSGSERTSSGIGCCRDGRRPMALSAAASLPAY